MPRRALPSDNPEVSNGSFLQHPAGLAWMLLLCLQNNLYLYDRFSRMEDK